MKVILKFIWLEADLLKRTIIIIGIILAVFSAAFLSVISVMIDIPLGLYNGLDMRLTTFECGIYGASFNEADRWGGVASYADIYGVTSDAELQVSSSGAFQTEQTFYYGSSEVTRNYNGKGVNLRHAELFLNYDGGKISGSWLDGEGQICLSSAVAESEYFKSPVKVGDTVNISGRKYTVVGIYDYDKVYSVNNRMLPPAYYYVSVGSTEKVSEVHINYPDSKTLNEAYKAMTRRGVNAYVSGLRIDTRSYSYNLFGNIDLVEAFFMAVALVLGLILIFILYSLMSIFYRQRKANICRMKMLGAKSGTVAGIYCSVTVVLLLFAVVIGAALSIPFNLYFTSLCEFLFGFEFAAHFYLYIPVCFFFAMTAISLCIYAFFNRKIKNAVIAQEVRHE